MMEQLIKINNGLANRMASRLLWARRLLLIAAPLKLAHPCSYELLMHACRSVDAHYLGEKYQESTATTIL